MKMMTKFITIGFILSMIMFFKESRGNINHSEIVFLNTKILNTPIKINKDAFNYNNPFVFIENLITKEKPKNKTEVKKNTIEIIITFTVKRFFNYCMYKFPVLKKLLLFIK